MLPSEILNKIFGALWKEKIMFEAAVSPLILEFQASSCMSWWRFWKDIWLWSLHHSIVCDLCYTRLLENIMNPKVAQCCLYPNLQPHNAQCVMSGSFQRAVASLTCWALLAPKTLQGKQNFCASLCLCTGDTSERWRGAQLLWELVFADAQGSKKYSKKTCWIESW